MSFLKNSPYYIILAFLISGEACKNETSHTDIPASSVEAGPAYKNLNDSIRQFPDDPVLYLRRAIRLTQENAHELAHDDFQKAWTIHPSLEVALPFAANLEILGKRSERLILLKSLNQRFPSNAQVGRLLAEAYTGSGKPDQAMIIYNNMIGKDSLDPETLYEKAMLLERMKDTVGAIAALQKAYGFQGVDTYGLELANLYAEQHNPRSLEICNYILKRDSGQLLIDPFFIKGIYYANIKVYQKAIAQFDSCIARDWKTTDAYLEKGRIYFHMENFNAAIQTFNMAMTVTNSDPDAYYWLGRCYESLHQKMEAVSYYRKALSLDKNFTEARQRMDKLDSGFAHPSH